MALWLFVLSVSLTTEQVMSQCGYQRVRQTGVVPVPTVYKALQGSVLQTLFNRALACFANPLCMFP